MNYKRLTTIASIFAAAIIPASAEPLIEIPKVAGKTAEEISKLLGKPSSQTKTKYRSKADEIKYAPTALYKDGKIEVVFIDGKAEWITISDMGNVPFEAKAIEALGLKPEPSTFKNSNVICWKPHSTYNSVAIFHLTTKRLITLTSESPPNSTLLHVSTESDRDAS